VAQIRFEKKIAFIYNPSSGKKIDRRATIVKEMDKHNILYEILTTTRENEALEIV
jgi:diacylglycerol kinase family enzyme